jgi:uncharacterized paraquat-inducible protein A
MCIHCHLVTPGGAEDLCHACAVELRAEARRGLAAIEAYLGAWYDLERSARDDD